MDDLSMDFEELRNVKPEDCIITVSLDIEENGESQGTAYFKIPTAMKEFLELCNSQYGIVGFCWPKGMAYLGVLLKEPLKKDALKELNPEGSSLIEKEGLD